MSRSYSQNMLKIVEDYRKAGQPWPTTAKRIAAWAIQNNLWKPQASRILTLCADLLAKSMREEYIVDPQGRKVRAKHAAMIKRGDEQLTIWGDIRSEGREHMEIAFKQRRNQIVGDCHQLKTDAHSFNDNRSPQNPIPMLFDFTDDLAEIEAIEKNKAA